MIYSYSQVTRVAGFDANMNFKAWQQESLESFDLYKLKSIFIYNNLNSCRK